MSQPAFHGSYAPEDVTILLTRVSLAPTPTAEKERRIQSGERHYSEMIGEEHVPSPTYLRAFHESVERNGGRLARAILGLAAHVAAERVGRLDVVSLARAGTPIGVLLSRALRTFYGREVVHSSVSIIRDRGLDQRALSKVLSAPGARAENVVFLDGWTGKGVIAEELAAALADASHAWPRLDPRLYVVSDLCGAADVAASTDDWVIPSSLLGATVSGLVSRSILNTAVEAAGGFHGCVYYEALLEADLSRAFVDRIAAEMTAFWDAGFRPEPLPAHDRPQAAARMADLTKILMATHRIVSRNHVKPGIGEATRVLLRREPGRLIVRDRRSPEVAHALTLAADKGVDVDEDPMLGLEAVALIAERP